MFGRVKTRDAQVGLRIFQPERTSGVEKYIDFDFILFIWVSLHVNTYVPY